MSRLLKIFVAVLALSMPSLGWAEGKIAVFDLQAAILQTDLAQKRMVELSNQEDFKTDKAEYDKLKAEFDELVKKFQKDAAVMSQEQQVTARNKLGSKQGDLEHLANKLKQAEQAAAQALFQEIGPKVQEVLAEVIAADGIDLLLQRSAVIHAAPSYSVTTKVTDKLNQLTTE